MFVYLETSKIYKPDQFKYRPDIYNLQLRKKTEMVQLVQIELSINSNTTRS